MEKFRTVALEPATATDEDVAVVHAVLSAAYAVDRPRDPALQLKTVTIRVRHRRAERRFRHYLATAAGTPAGVATLWLSDVDNLHMGLASVTVHPAYRGHGLGTELLRTVAAAAAADGRTVLLAESVVGTAGDGFAGAFGARLVAADRMSLLRLADVDGAEVERWAAAQHPGYRLEAHVGSLPEHRLDSYVRAKTAMNDAPH
jgi:mycothiol synthase